MNQLLQDQIVMLTRPSPVESDRLAELLHQMGARTVHVPVITIGPPATWDAVDTALQEMDRYSGLVFLSANGVHWWELRRRTIGSGTIRSDIPIYAMGSGTSQILRDLGYHRITTPAISNSEAMAELLIRNQPKGRLLILRGNRGSQAISQALQRAGIPHHQLPVYQSEDIQQIDSGVIQQMQSAKIDWVTLTSSAIAASAARLFGPTLKQSRIASISPKTTAVLKKFGLVPAAEAKSFDFEGLVQAMVQNANSPDRT